MSTGCGVTVASTIVEYKYCEGCGTKFVRVFTPLRRLKDGAVIDPNNYCGRCEAKLIEAAVHVTESIRYDGSGRLEERTHGEHRTEAAMFRECLRKHAFLDAGLAMRTAERMRKRHHGSTPSQAYRCDAHVDWTVVDVNQYPDHAHEHWHIGRRYDRH